MCKDCFHKDCIDQLFENKHSDFKCPKCNRDIY